MREVKKWKWLTFLVLLSCLLLAQFLSIPFVFGITLSIAPVIYLLSLRLFGYRFTLLLVSCMSVITYFLHIANMYIFLSILEVLVIGWLYHVKGKDLFNWSFIYAILLSVIYLTLEILVPDFFGIPNTISHFQILLTITLIIFSALIADILFLYMPLIPLINKWFKMKKNFRINFGQVISHILTLAAVIPILFIIMVNSGWLEDEMFQSYRSTYTQINNRLENKIVEMDSAEIQNYKLGSDLEKARIHSTLDEFLPSTEVRVIMTDSNGELWLDTSLNEEFVTEARGNVASIHENGYIWIPSEQQSLKAWYNGYYIGVTSFLNKDTFTLIPVKREVIDAAGTLSDYLILALLIITFALLFGKAVNHVLTKSLSNLNQMATDLPNKMKRQETFSWKDTKIDEFSRLGKNVKIVADRLQSMFIELEQKNKLLTKSEVQLHQLAHFDTLTKLPNRYSFRLALEKKLEEKKEKDTFAVVFIDLDKFKQVNDTLGHSGGDLLLKLFAKRLIDFSQSQPISFYRLAGDEFVAITEFTKKREVRKICEKMLDIISKPITISKKKIEISASIGISFYPDNGESIDQLLHHADTLMYEEKKREHSQRQFSSKRKDA